MTKLFVCFWVALSLLFSAPLHADEDSTQGKTWKTVAELSAAEEEFYLRPRLDVSKFPQERTIEISPELAARIAAQERAGHLVF